MINPKDVMNEGFWSITLPTLESSHLLAKLTVPANLAYFEGHFPGNPMLPGVAMVDFTLELVRKWPGFESAELQVLKSAKFITPVVPGTEIEICLTHDSTTSHALGETKWKAEWKLGGRCGRGGLAASFLFAVRI